MSSPDYLRSRMSPGRVPYPLMAWLPQRYALLSAGRRNRTGNRFPRPGQEAQALDGFQASASESSKFAKRGGPFHQFRVAFAGRTGIEPAWGENLTLGLKARCSAWLSYRPACPLSRLRYYSVLPADLRTLRAVSRCGEKTPNRDKRDSKRRAPRGLRS